MQVSLCGELKLQPGTDMLAPGQDPGRSSERKVSPLDLVNLEQRRNAVALECTYQINVLMLLANIADEFDGESQRSAVRSLTIRTRELTAILMNILRGDCDEVGDWEMRVFGSLQGSTQPQASDAARPIRAHTNFEPV